MSILTIATATLPGSHLPGYHERGFAFRVPRSQRRAVAGVMRDHGDRNGFEVDQVGFFGRIRCTYRERDAHRVDAFLGSSDMAGISVKLIPDYQSRYGVVED